MSEGEELRGYVEIWWQAIDDLTALLEEIPEESWGLPTDLPGWTVHDVAAHTAHLENLVAGGTHDDVEIGEPEHARGLMGRFTEQGVVARRDRSSDELINEIRASATARNTTLLAHQPEDGSAPAPGLFGAIGWTVRTLLRNRPLDVWMHEQDVRRAVGRPGNLDSPAAGHATSYLAESLGFVLAKKAQAPAGTTVVLELDGHPEVAATVGEDGRGQLLTEVPAEGVDATIRCDRESFLLLAGGRRQPEPGRVQIEGDAELGQRVLAALAVTP